MTVWHLLSQSARQFAEQPAQVRRPFSRHIFGTGARWMFGQLPPAGPALASEFSEQTNFTFYGSLKYGGSLLAALLVAGALVKLRWWPLLPLAGLAFYLVEVHLLFLFPLLLDRVAHPLCRSVQATYRVGLLRALGWTLVIAAYMLTGLLAWRQPWRRWHVGCLAVTRWYHEEIRAWARRQL